MDSHNPPTGGECALLEYDTVDVKYFSCSAIQFPPRSSPHTSHTWQFPLFRSSLAILELLPSKLDKSSVKEESLKCIITACSVPYYTNWSVQIEVGHNFLCNLNWTKCAVSLTKEKYALLSVLHLESGSGMYWHTLFIYSATGCCVWAMHAGTADAIGSRLLHIITWIKYVYDYMQKFVQRFSNLGLLS